MCEYTTPSAACSYIGGSSPSHCSVLNHQANRSDQLLVELSKRGSEGPWKWRRLHVWKFGAGRSAGGVVEVIAGCRRCFQRPFISSFLGSIVHSPRSTLQVYRGSAAAQYDEYNVPGCSLLTCGKPPVGGTAMPIGGQSRTVCQRDTIVVVMVGMCESEQGARATTG